MSPESLSFALYPLEKDFLLPPGPDALRVDQMTHILTYGDSTPFVFDAASVHTHLPGPYLTGQIHCGWCQGPGLPLPCSLL